MNCNIRKISVKLAVPLLRRENPGNGKQKIVIRLNQPGIKRDYYTVLISKRRSLKVRQVFIGP